MTLGIGFNGEKISVYVLARNNRDPVSTIAGQLQYASPGGVAGPASMFSLWPEHEKGRTKGGSQRANPQQMPSQQALVRCAATHPLTRLKMSRRPNQGYGGQTCLP